jgi:hypothetical protein
MGIVKIPPRALLFTGLLYNDSVDRESIFIVLNDLFGKTALVSASFPFTETLYYEAEMGKPIYRVFIGFENLIDPEDISDVKIRTNEIEEKLFSGSGGRDVNIDPGYLTRGKVVLATTKNYQHRIYLRRGIYAEVTLRYRGGSYKPWDWTYPDYKRAESVSFFNRLRELYIKTGRRMEQ